MVEDNLSVVHLEKEIVDTGVAKLACGRERKLQDQLDSIRPLAGTTEIPIVPIGNCELLHPGILLPQLSLAELTLL